MRSKRSSGVPIGAALARINLSDAERRIAQDSLVKGELVADLIIGAARGISYLIQRLRRSSRPRALRSSNWPS